MSVFITDLSNMSEKELSYAASLDKNDKIIIFHQENMKVNNFAALYLGLTKLKAKLEFIVMTAEVTEQSFLFQLGILSTENDIKKFILVYPTNSHIFNIEKLNDLTFATATGQGKVFVCKSFKTALKYSSSKSTEKKPRLTRTPKEKKDITGNNLTNMPLSENDEQFYSSLFKLEDGIIDFKEYSDVIRKSIRDSSDPIGLEILLSTNLRDKKLGIEIFNLIKDEYIKLKEFA